MLGAETMTSYVNCGLPKFASSRCGYMVKPANVETMESICDWADVVMVHTSIKTISLLDVKTDKPIIWACHDYVTGSEQKYLDKISACLVPSVGYKRLLEKNKFPVAVIHRKVASADWPEWPVKRLNGTIMAGIVGNNAESPWRDYTRALELCEGRLFVQSAMLPSQMADKFPVLELVDPEVMLKRIALFETSWAGCGNERISFDTIVNNKFHEGIAAGAVPILYRSREMSEYADQYECGITWSGQYPSPDQLYRIRESIQRQRAIHCLESERPILRGILSLL